MVLFTQRTAAIILLTFMAILLWGCASITTTRVELSPTPGDGAPAPGKIDTPDPASLDAQATIDAGQKQLLDLSRRATEISLNMSQAANAAARSTQEYIQRQKMEMDYQATIVSRNIAQAAATQEYFSQKTNTAREATTAAQNRAATAERSAFVLRLNETAQAQSILDAQNTQTAQALAALTNYPLTATPQAKTQAALLMQQYDREERSFVDRIVAPMIPILAVLDLVLLILVILVVYRWYLSWPHTSNLARLKAPPLTMIDGVIADNDLQIHQLIPTTLTPVSPLRLLPEKSVSIEIMNASEPPVAHWIADVEQQLAVGGELLP